jgi:hypothetical protein
VEELAIRSAPFSALCGVSAGMDVNEERKVLSLNSNAATCSQGPGSAEVRLRTSDILLLYHPSVIKLLSSTHSYGDTFPNASILSKEAGFPRHGYHEEKYRGSGNERLTGQGIQEMRGLYILLVILGGSELVCNEAQADGPSSRPESTDLRPESTDLSEADVEGNLEVQDLRPAGNVVTNSHTARWRVYTDKGRDLFTQVRYADCLTIFGSKCISMCVSFPV